MLKKKLLYSLAIGLVWFIPIFKELLKNKHLIANY